MKCGRKKKYYKVKNILLFNNAVMLNVMQYVNKYEAFFYQKQLNYSASLLYIKIMQFCDISFYANN